MDRVEISVHSGESARQALAAVAALRIAVFREFPYLYEGDPAYEQHYLSGYATATDAVFVLARAAGQVVGAATGVPLAAEPAGFQAPFLARGLPVAEVFYFGESVLLPAWRGQGVGHRFFDERERHAARLGRFRWTAFAAVERAPDDPRRPGGYRGNDAFWTKRGYQRQPGMTMQLAWQEIGESGESEKPLTFWLRELRSGTP